MRRGRQLQDHLARLWSDVLEKNSLLDDALSSARHFVVGYTAQEQYGALTGLLQYIYDQVLRQSSGAARIFGQIVHEACLQVTEPEVRHLLLGMSGFKYGKLLVDMQDFELALNVLHPTLEVLRQWPAEARASSEAATLTHLGIACTRTGRLDEGLHYYNQSLDLISVAGLHAQLPGLYFNLGNNSRLRGQADEACDFFRHAIDSGRTHASSGAVVPLAMLEIAKLIDAEQDAVLIKTYLEEALPRFEALGLQNACHDSYALLGRVYEVEHRPAAAVPYYEKALAVGTPSEDQLFHCIDRLVHIHVQAGLRDHACSILELLLQAAEQGNHERQILHALEGLARLLFAGPATERLIAVCARGSDLAEKRQERNTQALFLGYLGDTYQRLGQEDKADRMFERALQVVAEAEPDSWMPSDSQRIKQQHIGPWHITVTKVGGAEVESEQPKRESLEEWLDTQPIGFTSGIGALHGDGSVDGYRGARFFHRQGIPLSMRPDAYSCKTGQMFLREAFDLYIRGGHLWEAQAVARVLGRSHEVHAATAAALIWYEESVDLLERYRGYLLDHDNRISYLARCAEAFHDAVRLCLRNGDPDAAFQFAERGKARSLVDLLLESQGRRAETTAHFTAADAQRELIDDSTALLEYLLGDDESYVFVLTRSGLQVHTLPPADTMVDQWAKLRAALLEGRGDWKRPARHLYKHLVCPVEQVIAGKRLVIVTDGVLDFLPFEVLLTEEPTSSTGNEDSEVLPFLLNRHTVIYSPSAATLATVRLRTAIQDKTWPKDFIGFAPINFCSAARLPKTEDEVCSVAQLFPADRATVHVGVSATKKVVCGADLRQYRLVHFATHGHADQNLHELCGLVFPDAGQDNLLHAAEVLQFDLTADLVTASACVTGLGRQIQGEGIMGLKRSFLHAGARSVCVSLWSVADDATAELMTRFYRHLLAGRLDKAESLRQAKRELIGSRRWAAPFYWAAFVLSGDWRSD